MLNVYDNVITDIENNDLYKYFLFERKYRYGERDRPELAPVGISSDLEDGQLLDKLKSVVESACGEVKDLKLKRAYVNLFSPNDRPFFHRDGNVITCLLYVTLQSVSDDIDEGGETQFIIKNQLRGIFPKPGRLVVFDGNIRHRATSFRTQPRLTIALKYSR